MHKFIHTYLYEILSRPLWSTLLLFHLFSCETLSTQKTDVIGILPYQGIKNEDIDSVQAILQRTYHIKTVVLNEIKLPKSAFVQIKSPRYRADSLLHIQSRNMPDSIDILIGLSPKDISTTKYQSDRKTIKTPASKYTDWGIFGLGEVGGKSCIVSTYRLRNKVSKKQYFTRLQRIATHEVGHVLGLHHCPTPECVMNDANESISTIDKSTGELCQKCWSKIN